METLIMILIDIVVLVVLGMVFYKSIQAASKQKIDSLEALKQELLNCKIDEEKQEKEEKLVRIKR